MANASEKNAVKKYQYYKDLYLKIIIALTAIYATIRIWYFNSSFTITNWVGFIFLSLVNYFGYKILMSFLANGHPRTSYGVYEEILWVNWFIMATTILSDWFWLLYLSVPIYGIYHFGPMVFNFCFPKRPEIPTLTPEEQEKADKKAAKKANRVKYVRR